MEIKYSGLPADMLDIGDIVVINQKLNKVDPWLLDTFFSGRRAFERDYIVLGDLETATPLAPYVAPHVEGRPILERGTANVTTIKPAYLKPKAVITPCQVYDSRLFEALKTAGIIANAGGRVSDGDRLVLDQFAKQKRLRDSIDNRVKLMAAELLTTGKLVVRSDDQPEFTVDYGRDPSATFAPALPWTDPLSTPVQDINDMLELSYDLNMSGATHVLTTTKVWNALVKHQDFNDTFVKPFAGINVPYTQTMQANPSQAQFRGYLPGGTVAIWTYDAKYDLNGVQTSFLPVDFFGIINAPQGRGFLAHCAIQHLEAYGQPLEYFDYQWVNKDPSAIFMISESSPMVVPASANMTVGGVGFVV